MQRLRAATRALRLHLEELPIDYDERVPPAQFLTGMAFMFARNRYSCADSMIGSGFGGTVVGAIARSVLTDGLRWLWVAQDQGRGASILGDLLEERSRIASVVSPNAEVRTRLLMPVPPVADLTGASRSWVSAPATPREDDLLDDLLSSPGDDYAGASVRRPDLPNEVEQALLQARHFFDLAGLRGAAAMLAHAGHGNYLGQRSTLTIDGTPGFDLRADHEALFMHVAAVGVFAVLAGTASVNSEVWPHDVDRPTYLAATAALVDEVTKAAPAVHQIGARAKARKRAYKPLQPREPVLPCGAVVLENAEIHADYLDAHERMAVLHATVDHLIGLVVDTPAVTTPPPEGVPLHIHLTQGWALSNLQTIAETRRQPGATVMCAFAGRALLEEAARLHWRYSVTGEDEARGRAKQYFDEYRARQVKTVRVMAGHGVNKKDALRLFDLPPNVLVPPGADQIAKNRTPIPSITAMLRSFGAAAHEPRWLETTYSMLSQITHATPLGYLHSVRHVDGEWIPNELSLEVLALSLDAAALGSAHLLGLMGLMLDNVSPAAQRQFHALKAAATAVHLAAQQVHGLDLPSGGTGCTGN